MSLNIGYLKSKNDNESQECYTPYYAVEPIFKYIPANKTIWCPFDEEWSAFVKYGEMGGWRIIRSHIKDNQDFLSYEPNEDYDYIISNPPFKLKDKIIKRLYELDKPFAILLPLNTLQGKMRYEYFKKGIQLLSFDDRIGYHSIHNMTIPQKSSCFASAYFCKDILPKDLIIEHIEKYERPLT